MKFQKKIYQSMLFQIYMQKISIFKKFFQIMKFIFCNSGSEVIKGIRICRAISKKNYNQYLELARISK